MPRTSPPMTLGPHPHINRNLHSTWVITLAGLLFFEVVFVMLWVTPVSLRALDVPELVVSSIAGIIWMASTVALLERYRSTYIETRWSESWLMTQGAVVCSLLVAVVVGVLTWRTTGLLVAGFFPLAQSMVLLRWGQGIRAKVTLLVTALLVGLFLMDRNQGHPDVVGSDSSSMVLLVAYSIAIPAFSVLSLWWWDVVVELENARQAESELSATRERLRLANDLHDLQGHHLQVVALQLELTERLLEANSDAGMDHLREARLTVATAQRETRDLATKMRPVNIQHELENAAELLRVAGADVKLTITQALVDLPNEISEVLAPVVRETTTNVLRHGGGKRAEIGLERTDSSWEYFITNDVPQNSPARHDGSGLASIKQRVGDIGGDVSISSDRITHSVTVRIPLTKASAS